MKILIVEDNFIERNLMVSMLKQYGTCHIAVNGEEAINVFKDSFEDPYDVICLDINMPVKNGQEALKEIREFESNLDVSLKTKIIMTTGMSDGHNMVDAFDQKCDGYLVKPIKLDDILELFTSLELVDK
ncbi:MAG: response regulator [Planctomycetota bacterium]|nr:MAG: response regulator [Planctomycetota bacterium]